MSIFKRLFGEKDDNISSSAQIFKTHINNSNIKSIGSNLQKRFSRGVQYNMKIVIRGDRNVGKSALLARLKGLDFCEKYIPTDEIEVACIHWNYKSTDDVVKVEVWDVVDKGRKKKQSGLKLENASATEDNPGSMCLDAEFLDVYKGAHAVIMVLDITKSWTLSYVERELQCVPENIPMLILANHRDMGSHRTVTNDQVQSLVESMPSFKKGLLKYWESSMKNGYGLIYIHRFFNIPFLQLQKDTLIKQLTTNEMEMNAVLQELEDLEEEPDSLYENFIANLKHTKISQSQKPSSLSLNSNPASQINSPTIPASVSQVHPKGSVTPMAEYVASNHDRPTIHPPQARPIPGMDKLGLYPLPVPCDSNSKSDVVNSSNSQAHCQSTAGDIILPVNATSRVSVDKRNIDEFVPDEQPELSTFLDDMSSGLSPKTTEELKALDSSSDENDYYRDGQSVNTRRLNPMVAGFQDEIDIDDVVVVDSTIVHCPTFNDTASSDEDRGYAMTAVNKNKSQITVGKVQEMKTDETSLKIVNGSDCVNTLPINDNQFNAADLDILDQMLSRKELDGDDTTTVNSNSSTKKKKKKHHKEPAVKDGQSKKKKKKSKLRSRDSSPKEVIKSSPQNSRKSSKTSKKSEDIALSNSSTRQDQVIEPDFTGDRSDSLERFLND